MDKYGKKNPQGERWGEGGGGGGEVRDEEGEERESILSEPDSRGTAGMR